MRILGSGHVSVPRSEISTYCYAVPARKFVTAGRAGLALVVTTASFVGVVEDLEVVVINVITGKDIGD